METTPRYSRVLKQQRLKMKLTQQDAADLTEMSWASYWKRESGRVKVTKTMLLGMVVQMRGLKDEEILV